MNKRIKKKHFDRFATGVMYFRNEGNRWNAYRGAKPFNGRDGRRLYQYALECGHIGVFCGKPEFNPRHKYVFSVEESPTGVRRVSVERV